MTTVIIKSDSESKTDLLIKLAEELGLAAEKQEPRELTVEDMAFGIGRKATDEELENYLNKGIDEEPIPAHIAFAKYLSVK